MRRSGLACLAAALLAPGLGALAQPVPVDGVYDGTASILGSTTGRNASGRCQQTIPFKLRIQDRSFTWRLPTSTSQVGIAPDGTFSAQNASRFINGRVTGGHLAAQTTGRGCNYVWSFDRE